MSITEVNQAEQAALNTSASTGRFCRWSGYANLLASANKQGIPTMISVLGLPDPDPGQLALQRFQVSLTERNVL